MARPRASANGSITVLESEPSVIRAPASRSATEGPMPSASSASVVGQKQTELPDAPSAAMSAGVRWVAWTAVVRGPHTPTSASSWTGVRPVAARHAWFSAGCSETCTCSGASGSVPAAAARWAGATARTEWMAVPITTRGSPRYRDGEVRDPSLPDLQRQHEPLLCRVQGLVGEPGPFVAAC